MATSCDLKLDRAEKHLREFQQLAEELLRTHPYELVRVDAPARNVHRLRFTVEPDPMMKVIVGDFIHNVRSALDHQAAALVPIERRGETTFPIMFVGVWESPRPDDDGLMISQRKRWTKAVKGMDPDAVTILKRLQSNPVVHLSGPHISGGVILNRLSNLDKHDALIELSLRLLRPTFTASVGGDIVVSDVGFDPRDGLIDGAEFESLIDADEVTVSGDPRIIVRVGGDGFLVPEALRELLNGARKIVESLRPFNKT